jgi:RNase P subunit RPR2
MLQLIGSSSADYFGVQCAKCKTHVRVKYLGLDPAVPQFEATCATCGQTARFKVAWEGLPSKTQ